MICCAEGIGELCEFLFCLTLILPYGLCADVCNACILRQLSIWGTTMMTGKPCRRSIPGSRFMPCRAIAISTDAHRVHLYVYVMQLAAFEC